MMIVRREITTNSMKLFTTSPFYWPLLLANESSDARDHCANERTFLSWVRLAIYMDVVSVAIFVNFHFKEQPTPLELKMSKPLGAIFWALSFVCIINGFANYIKTVARYARRRAMVQYGGKTQIVFFVVGATIIGACAAFIAADSENRRR